jgi:hypothetical protein
MMHRDGAHGESPGSGDIFCHGGYRSTLCDRNSIMRLFLFAFAISAMATAALGQSPVRDANGSGSQPIRSSRFEPSEKDEYLMHRARAESERRAAIVRYYDSIGFNYGAPEINGSVFFLGQPPIRFRRVFWTPPALMPNPYGM